MSITQEKKQELLKQYSISENDTGSAQVQCAVLTERILNLTQHLKVHKHDFSCKRTIIILVNRRNSLLKYLKNKNFEKYKSLVLSLGLRMK